MAADNTDLESLVHLEQTCYDAGYTDGFAHGRIHGLIEGRALGRLKGFEIWEEIGFYQGFASTWGAIYADMPVPPQDPRDRDRSRRVVHHIHHILDLIRRFPTVNPSATLPASVSEDEDEMDLPKLQRQIRSRYKALCACLGVRPTLRASIGMGADEEDGHVSGGSRDAGDITHGIRSAY